MVPELEAEGMQFVGKDETGERMEIVELSNNPPDHPFFVAAQFHPEFKSRCGGREGGAAGGAVRWFSEIVVTTTVVNSVMYSWPAPRDPFPSRPTLSSLTQLGCLG